MKKIWFEEAWEDYTYWQTQDRKTLKRVNLIIKDIERNNFNGIGKPEPLRGDLSGFWSRHIDEINRLIYRIKTIRLKFYPVKDTMSCNASSFH